MGVRRPRRHQRWSLLTLCVALLSCVPLTQSQSLRLVNGTKSEHRFSPLLSKDLQLAETFSVAVPQHIKATPTNASNGFNVGATVAWANKCCGGTCSECPCNELQDQCACECAEFVSRSLSHGGINDGIIKWVPSLWSWLKDPANGWKLVGSNPSSVVAGAVIIYEGQGHTCIGVGSGVVDCHNNNHCGITADLGIQVDGVFIYQGGSSPSPSTGPSPSKGPSPSSGPYPPPHHVLPPAQIAGMWKGAGGSDSTCTVAVAVSLAESGGDCSAQNINTDSHHSIDRGLWQINDYWHPEISNQCAYDCACNAKGALSISSGGSDFSPWSTFNSGAYKSHLAAASTACKGSTPVRVDVLFSLCMLG